MKYETEILWECFANVHAMNVMNDDNIIIENVSRLYAFMKNIQYVVLKHHFLPHDMNESWIFLIFFDAMKLERIMYRVPELKFINIEENRQYFFSLNFKK